MTKYKGKITAALVAIILVIAGIMTYQVKAAATPKTGPSVPFAVHVDMGIGFTVVGDAYAIITDLSNLDMMHATTGVADVAYGNCAITFTADGQNTDWALATIPALDLSKEYAITIYENGTPAAGNTCIIKPAYYNPVTGKTYGSYNPVSGGAVSTGPKPIHR